MAHMAKRHPRVRGPIIVGRRMRTKHDVGQIEPLESVPGTRAERDDDPRPEVVDLLQKMLRASVEGRRWNFRTAFVRRAALEDVRQPAVSKPVVVWKTHDP